MCSNLKVFFNLSLICLYFLISNQAQAMRPPAIEACQQPWGCDDGWGSPPGGSAPLHRAQRDILVTRELTSSALRSPSDCSLANVKTALVNYIEDIEGTEDELALEALSHPNGGTIDDWVDFHIEKEIQTPWSEVIGTYGFVGKQLVTTHNGNLPVDTSHVSLLVKCDKNTGEMNLVSLRSKHFPQFTERSPYEIGYVVKFDQIDGVGGAFDVIDAYLLATDNMEACESVVGSAHQFLYPGTTRLTEALSITTSVPDDGSCGSPPLFGGRVITVSADDQEVTIENNAAHLDVNGHVYAHVTANPGPYKPSFPLNVRLKGLRNIDVEAYDGGLCSNEQIVQTDENGRYDISFPVEEPQFLWCQINMPNPSDSRSECGVKLGFIEVNDRTGNYFTHGEDCKSGGSMDDIIFNGPTIADMTEHKTAQANVFYHTEKARDWILKDIDSVSAGILEPAIVNANINLDPSTFGDCFAYYDFGTDTMRFTEGNSTCYNMAFDSPIIHEYGHFVDSILGDLSRGNSDFETRIALSEGWSDGLAAITTGMPLIGFGMYKSGGGNNYIRSLVDTTPWFDPVCLQQANPGNVCGPGSDEPCNCPQLGVECPSIYTDVLECRRYLYGDTWASMLYELHDRLKSEYEDDPTYANQVILSALALDSRNITEGVINILQADNSTVRSAENESPHLCTIQSVTDKFGFPRYRVLELLNFQDCFFKTYKDEAVTPTTNYRAMFNTLRKDQGANYFYLSGYSLNGPSSTTPSRYFHTRINEQGDVQPNWTPSSLNNIYAGFEDRGKAVIDTATQYLVFGLAGTPINQPGGNFLLGSFLKSDGSGSITGYGHIPGDPTQPHPLNMAQSVQPIDGGTNGYVISGITTQAAQPPENDCFPGIPCGDAFVGYLNSSFQPEGNPTGTDILAFNPQVIGTEHQDIFHEAKQIETNKIVVAGSLVGNGTRNAVLLKNDIRQSLTGDLFTLDIPDTTTDAVYRDVIKFQDSGGNDAFLAVGFSENSENDSMLISKIDYDLAGTNPEIWTLQFDSTTGGSAEKATSVMPFADDGTGIDKFLVAGASGSKVVLLKIDEDGNKLWCKKYRYFHSDIQGPNLAITSDGMGFLIAGQYADPNTYDPAAVMRITLDGDAPTFIEDCDGYGFPTNRPGQQQSSARQNQNESVDGFNK